MLSFLKEFFQEKQIELWGALPLGKCRLLRPYLIERENVQAETVIMLALPYYTPSCDDPQRNISAYAVGLDYHIAFKELFDELLPLLHNEFPQNSFAAFADHSPIDEIDAAARAGLGVIGENKLLLTQKYASYVFLGEIITDAQISITTQEPKSCLQCGACSLACPTRESGICLSALTQKKGHLTVLEQETIEQFKCVWGCDICQEACPYTVQAHCKGTIYTPLEFFYRQPISRLKKEDLLSMSDTDFEKRAYAWRGKNTIMRNLEIIEKGERIC